MMKKRIEELEQELYKMSERNEVLEARFEQRAIQVRTFVTQHKEGSKWRQHNNGARNHSNIQNNSKYGNSY